MAMLVENSLKTIPVFQYSSIPHDGFLARNLPAWEFISSVVSLNDTIPININPISEPS